MEKKAVAQVCLTGGQGGLELAALKLHRQFLQKNWSGVTFCLENSFLETKLDQEGLPRVSLKGGKYLSPQTTLGLRRAIKKHQIKVLFVHHLRDLWLLVPALFGLPEVKVFGIAHMFLRNIDKKDFLHRKIYGRLSGLISLTSTQALELQKCLPVEKDHYKIIPNGIDLSLFKPEESSHEIRKQLGAKTESRLIGVVGRLDPMKGQREFLLAARKLLDKYSDLHFVIVGDPTPGLESFSEELNHLIEELGLSNHVTLVGFRSDMSDVMNALDIFVMPSWEETFGVVLIEAMACGVPSVATKAGGVVDIINPENVVGRLALPKNADSLAESISFYLDDWSQAKQVGQRGRDHVLKNFNQESTFNKILELI